ncbi:hypothetical protein ACT6QH_09180 [Xanthobacter sp. TB0139]|uniref:hypothetical protein n=1 Tax=Xanthobacter sp. TB0139 TaxID=3459178 RepID=UPI0040396844
MFFSRYAKPAHFERVISLGHFCVTRHQISRHLKAEKITTPGTQLFDWQTTPPAAMLEYFARDFQGLFHFEDLEIAPEGCARHRELLTLHPHEFGEPIYELTPERLAAVYPEARQRHDYLAEKFRAQIRSRNTPTLYVIAHFLDEEQSEQLVAALGRHRGHRFHIAMIASDGIPPPPRSEISAFSIDPNMPGGWRWEGHDDEWTRVLSQFQIISPRPHRHGLAGILKRLRGK